MKMKVTPARLDGVLIIEPQFFGDRRGFFAELYQKQRYFEAGVTVEFVQDNISFSRQNALRGLHYQYPHPQAKLVQALRGEIFDVAVDIRRGSPTFGQWVGMILSEENRCQLYIPEGFAHGFCVISETALFSYKCSACYDPQAEGGICWNDPELNIDWPIRNPLLSDRDRVFGPLKSLSFDRLPPYGA